MMNEDAEMLAEQFNIALEGRKVWIEIKEKYGICDEDGVVICVTAETGWLREIKNWILPFIERKRFNRLFYISSSRLSVEDHKFIQIILQDDIISKIIKYYKLTNLVRKVYIISLNEPFGNENMIGHKGITIADWLKNFG